MNKFILILAIISTIFISCSLSAQQKNIQDTIEVEEIKGALSLSKNDDGIHAFRYLFSNTLQNKSSYLKFGERILYSTSFVWIADNGYYKENWQHIFTWYNGISLNVGKSLYVGVHYLAIHTKGSVIYTDKESENYKVYGLVLQYDFFPRFENRLYLESSINKGDICSCGNDDPYKVPDLLYLGIGFGYDFPIYKRLTFRMGFTNYSILSKIKDKYNFTQYVLGLNVNLSKNTYRSDISFLELFN